MTYVVQAFPSYRVLGTFATEADAYRFARSVLPCVIGPAPVPHVPDHGPARQPDWGGVVLHADRTRHDA